MCGPAINHCDRCAILFIIDFSLSMKEILRYGYTEMPKIDAILAMYKYSAALKHNNCEEDESVVIY